MLLRSAAMAGLAGLAACAGRAPPQELRGLWSVGQAACEAGVGVRFEPDRIAAVYADQREVLFAHPSYDADKAGDEFRVRIEYELPRPPGGAVSLGAHGVLVLERGEGGYLKPMTHALVDPRTGSVRMRIEGDPALAALALRPCGAHPWLEGLRGRTGA